MARRDGRDRMERGGRNRHIPELDTARTLRAVHRLSLAFPSRSQEERLEKIKKVLAGELDPREAVRTARTSPADLIARMKAGRASRAVRTAEDLLTDEEIKAKRVRQGAALTESARAAAEAEDGAKAAEDEAAETEEAMS